jgi:hypothetical protein
MNEQLPPIDARLREQLARRSGGRLPEGLLDEVASGLDAVPTSRPSVSVSFARPAPRAAGALVALAAVVALLAALVAVPALRTGPAFSGSYPTDRALTTAELAALMAGPALATNTALVADVTIQPNPDVCPMDRYPTYGVVEGMRSQVCVMYQGLSSYRTTEPQSGVFAFRYLAPGVLGLIDEITPASSRLSFTVTEDWPLAGKAFVVDGWLGAVPTLASCAYPPTTGDVLSPHGEDCPYDDWLGAESTAPSLEADYNSFGGASASYDPLSLRGSARHVQAGGMRQIDGLDSDIKTAAPTVTPVHGQYIVRSAVGPCPGASPVSSVGCSYWLVLAKLADIALPSPTPSPSPTLAASPTPAYPTERALTTSELGRLLDAGSLKQYDTVVVDAEVTDPGGSCRTPYGSYGEFAGSVAGIEPQVCVYVRVYGGATTQITPGHLVLRMLDDRTLGYMGTVADGPRGLAYSTTDAWPDGFFLVHGWLDTDAADCGQSSLPGHGGPDPLFPAYSTMCHAALTPGTFGPPAAPSPSGPVTTPAGPAGGVPIATYPVPSDGRAVDAAPYFELPAYMPVTGSKQGTFVVDKAHHCSAFDATACEDYYVLAGLADVIPPPAPVATPTPEPPATLAYPSDRALTTAELGALLDAGSLKQYDTVVVDAEVTAEASGACQSPGVPDIEFAGFIVGLDPQVCVYGVPGGSIAPGHLLLRVLRDRTLGYISTLPDSPHAYGVMDTWPNGGSFLVNGWLGTDAHDCGKPGAVPSLIGYGLFPDYQTMCYAVLTATEFDPTKQPYNGPTPAGPPRIAVDPWDVPPDGKAVDPGPMYSMPGASPVSGSVEGTYVVTVDQHCSEYGFDCVDWSVLTRLADVTPPPVPIPTVATTPTSMLITPSGYPASRALTTDELGQFLQTDGVKDKAVVAQVTLGKANCPTLGPYVPMGVVVGLESVCVVGIGDGRPEHSPAASSGTFALRVLDSQTLGFMGNVSVASSNSVSYSADTAWPSGATILVSGWLTADPAPRHCPMMGAVSPEPVDPGGIPCGGVWLSGTQMPAALPSGQSTDHMRVLLEPDYPSINAGVQSLAFGSLATYLVRDEAKCNYSYPTASEPGVEINWDKLCGWQIMARVDPVTLPTPAPTPAPTTLAPTSTLAVGLWGSGDRPLTLSELYGLWANDPDHLVGLTLVVKGPVPTGFECRSAGTADPSERPGACNVVILDGTIAPEGYWAIRVGADGRLGLIGQLSTPESRFVSTIAKVNLSGLTSGQLVVVDAWLGEFDTCGQPQASATDTCYFDFLSADGQAGSIEKLIVQGDAFTMFGGAGTGSQPVHAKFLISWGGDGRAPILARMETRGSNP